jgi:uncharacterized membrane protein
MVRSTLKMQMRQLKAALSVGLLIPQMRHVTAMLLIIFFVLILPANINAAIRKVNYQKGAY